jgi:recombination protein RecT
MNAIVEQKKQTPSQEFRDQLQKMDNELASALPPHIPVERFMRIVLTAVNADGGLLNADRRSLFAAAMKAAQDGLLPDGRDGAFVIYNSKVKIKDEQGREKDIWINKVQWMPMVGGILKKIRNSGDLKTIAAHVAYSKDKFVYILGDDEKIEHEPSMDADRGEPIAAYAIAKTKDGGIYREVMSVSDVEEVRAVSKAAKSGPWVSWWGEMAKKTVLRRLAKRLPMSTDLDDLIRRDDELYDFNGKGNGEGQVQRLFKPVRNPLSDENQIEHDAGDDAPADTAKTYQSAPPADGTTAGSNTNSTIAADASPVSGAQADPEKQTEAPASGSATDQAPADGDDFPGDRPSTAATKAAGRKFIKNLAE